MIVLYEPNLIAIQYSDYNCLSEDLMSTHSKLCWKGLAISMDVIYNNQSEGNSASDVYVRVFNVAPKISIQLLFHQPSFYSAQMKIHLKCRYLYGLRR